jgi:hypothetical protein
MDLYFWIIPFTTALFLYFVIRSFTAAGQRSLLKGMAAEAEIGVPRALAEALQKRATNRARWGAVSAVAAMLLLYSALVVSGVAMTPSLYLLCLATSIIGYSFAVACVSLRFEGALSESTVRLARLRRVRIGDYVGPWPRALAWITVAFGGVLTVADFLTVAAGHSNHSAFDLFLPSLCTVGAGIVGLALFEIGARAIVRRAQPAGSTDELVWDDALRASAIRDLLGTAVFTVYAGSLAAFVLSRLAPEGTGLAFLLRIGALGLWVLYTVANRDSRARYLEKLWPGARRRTAEERADLERVEARAS